MVRAAEKTQAAVLDALREGSFYGSTGPTIESIEVDVEGGGVEIAGIHGRRL